MADGPDGGAVGDVERTDFQPAQVHRCRQGRRLGGAGAESAGGRVVLEVPAVCRRVVVIAVRVRGEDRRRSSESPERTLQRVAGR